MARIGKLEINYDNLSDTYKALYNELSKLFQDMSILEIRNEAHLYGIDAPTSFVKEELIDFTVGRMLLPYLPPSNRLSRKLWSLFKDGDNELVKGFCEYHNGEWFVGKVVIFPLIAKEHELREGDRIEGMVGDINGVKMLVTLINLESDGVKRLLFSDIHATNMRPYRIEGTAASELLGGLQVGERVIMRDMSLETANRIAESFAYSVRLFLGLAPEYESNMDKELFVAEFSLSKAEKLAIARLSVERSKRIAERGKEVALVVMGFDMLNDSDIEHSIIGAGRCFDTGGLTVIVQMGEEKHEEYKTIATRIV